MLVRFFLFLLFLTGSLCSYNLQDILFGANLFIGYGNNCYLHWRTRITDIRTNAEFYCGSDSYVLNNMDKFKMQIFPASHGSQFFLIKSGNKAFYWTGSNPINAEFRANQRGDTFWLQSVGNGYYKIGYGGSTRLVSSGSSTYRNAQWQPNSSPSHGLTLWIKRISSESLAPFIGKNNLQLGFGEDCYMFWAGSSDRVNTVFKCGAKEGVPIEIIPISGSMEYRIKSRNRHLYWLGGSYPNAQFRLSGSGDRFLIEEVFPNRYRISYRPNNCVLLTEKSSSRWKNAAFKCGVAPGTGDVYWIKVNGEWSNWSAWSVCSRNCNSGKTSRKRTCSNPAPLHGGRECVGNKEEEKSCNTEICQDAVCELQPGDGKSSREIALNQKPSFKECVKACLERKLTDHGIDGVTISSGVTLGGVVNKCFCEVSVSGTPHSSSNYQTCKLVFKAVQCAFSPGEGISDGKIDIGSKSSPYECAKGCYERSKSIPSINGVTIPGSFTQAVSRCLCDKNFQKSNIDRTWKSGRIEITDALCDMKPGDGTGVGEILLPGRKATIKDCVKACLLKRKEDNRVNGVTVAEGVEGDIERCFCEKLMTGRRYSSAYKTCNLVFQEWKFAVNPGEAVSQASISIGAKSSIKDCAKSCFEKSKTDHTIDGISARMRSINEVEDCVCEKAFSRSNMNVNWRSCPLSAQVPSIIPKSRDADARSGRNGRIRKCRLKKVHVSTRRNDDLISKTFDREAVFAVASRGCCFEPITIELDKKAQVTETALLYFKPSSRIDVQKIENVAVEIERTFLHSKEDFRHIDTYKEGGSLVFSLQNYHNFDTATLLKNSSISFDCPGGAVNVAYGRLYTYKHDIKAIVEIDCGGGRLGKREVSVHVDAYGYEDNLLHKAYVRKVTHEKCNADFLNCLAKVQTRKYPNVLTAHTAFRSCFKNN